MPASIHWVVPGVGVETVFGANELPKKIVLILLFCLDHRRTRADPTDYLTVVG